MSFKVIVIYVGVAFSLDTSIYFSLIASFFPILYVNSLITICIMHLATRNDSTALFVISEVLCCLVLGLVPISFHLSCVYMLF